MKLVIVESPTKAKTIGKFIGPDYHVESSYGHIRDLPRSTLGIDVDHNFEPQYVIPRKVQPRVTALKKALKKSDGAILATDEDREGEAIAWHLTQALGLEQAERIVFHEVTRGAIEEALTQPRLIDMHLVDAQQARRVLDRLVGYKLSPFLWKKIGRGLSAGRVQSVALRLIADREEEIKNFKTEEYWTVNATLQGARGVFDAFLYAVNDEPVPKLGIKTDEHAKEIVADLEQATFTVTVTEKKEVRKNPLPPLITSTLQQTAAKRLGISSKKTMYLAQQLYENGYITYMRTDSISIAQVALTAAEKWIRENLDSRYVPRVPRVFKNKSKLAQEAHECIRPTEIGNEPSHIKVEKDQKRLYELIWRRFIASQLPPAVFEATSVEIGAKHKHSYTLRANGNTLRFDGFLKIWPVKFEEKELPLLEAGESLKANEVRSERHETEPPPRYNEASLVKTLEKYGIGRPSTYAPTISVIQERNYVEKNQGRFYPTEIGTLVNKVLTEHFPEIVDVQFTATMEEELDEIARGKQKWQSVIRGFYEPFAKHLEEKYESVSKEKIVNETTNEICEKCGKPMIIRYGRFGKFMACSGFPECKNTKTLKEPPKQIGMKCPVCSEGEVIERFVHKGRARGKKFWGCSRYPACDYASWTNPLGEHHADER